MLLSAALLSSLRRCWLFLYPRLLSETVSLWAKPAGSLRRECLCRLSSPLLWVVDGATADGPEKPVRAGSRCQLIAEIEDHDLPARVRRLLIGDVGRQVLRRYRRKPKHVHAARTASTNPTNHHVPRVLFWFSFRVCVPPVKSEMGANRKSLTIQATCTCVVQEGLLCEKIFCGLLESWSC